VEFNQPSRRRLGCHFVCLQSRLRRHTLALCCEYAGSLLQSCDYSRAQDELSTVCFAAAGDRHFLCKWGQQRYSGPGCSTSVQVIHFERCRERWCANIAPYYRALLKIRPRPLGLLPFSISVLLGHRLASHCFQSGPPPKTSATGSTTQPPLHWPAWRSERRIERQFSLGCTLDSCNPGSRRP
jgi:hypothetical protein